MIKINELSASKFVLQNLTEEEASSITGGISIEGAIGNGGASNGGAIDAVNRSSAIEAETAAIGAMAANNSFSSQSWRMLKAASSQLKGAGG